MKSKLISFISELYATRNVLQQLIAQQLILRYRRTILGYLWTLINPLLMMSVMAVVFSSIYKVDLESFTVFLFAGMIPWNFFSSVVTQSGTAFISNEGLIKKIYLPKAIFPLSVSIALLTDSLLSFVALFFIMLILGSQLSWALLFLPVCFTMLFVFSLGIGLIMAVATVFFRDLQYVVSIMIQGLFFVTPILYKQDMLSGKVSWVVDLNPVTPFVTLFRAPLIDAELPDTSVLLQAGTISTVIFIIGLFVFIRLDKKIVYRL